MHHLKAKYDTEQCKVPSWSVQSKQKSKSTFLPSNYWSFEEIDSQKSLKKIKTNFTDRCKIVKMAKLPRAADLENIK